MKIMKFALRFWIAVTSVVSFLVGWAMLAHSPKPVQAKALRLMPSLNVTALPTLAPLPPLGLSGSPSGGAILVPPVSVQQPPVIIQQPPVSSFAQPPLLSTGGS